MKLTIEQTKKLLSGNQEFKQFGFAMMLTRLRTKYSRDPSQETLQTSMDEINVFLEKFASIMANDFAIISQL